MPVYTYRGVNRAGATVAGERAADSKDELAAMLRREQINVSKLSEKGREFNIPTFGTGVEEKELAIFTRQFSVMIDAGLPLVQCLEILAGQQENKTFQKMLNCVRASVEGGATLSASMKQHEKVFDAAVLQHGGGGRDGRYSGHDSAAALDLHREERQTEARREVRDDLPDLRAGHRRRRDHPSAVEGRADFRHVVQRPGRRSAAADADRNRPEPFRGKHLRPVDSRVLCRRRYSR